MSATTCAECKTPECGQAPESSNASHVQNDTIVECQSVVRDVVDAVIMQKFEYDGVGLRGEIQEYKQLLWALKDENSLLKVKVHKLEEILKKKNRIVDTHYLGTHNKLLFKEAMHQFTHRIDTLQMENQDLKDELIERDMTIRKLRKQIGTYSAYKPLHPNKGKKKPASASASRATERAQDQNSQNSRSQSQSALASSHLRLKLKESAHDAEDAEDTECATASSAPAQHAPLERDENDTDRAISCSLLLDTPHEEIEKLHCGFKDILSEVGKLKHTMSEISEQHTREVREMRMRENDLLARIYDKEKEVAYRAMRGMGGQDAPNSRQPTVQTRAQNAPTSLGDRLKPQRPASAFAKIPVGPKFGKGKKQNALAIRTVSRSSLHDETDMRLYIDEVLNDMNRNGLN